MSNQYLTNALFDALAEAAKNRDLSAVKEMYNWLVDPTSEKSEENSVLQLTMPVMEPAMEEKRKNPLLHRAYKYHEVLEILEREKILDRFVQYLPPFVPYRISLHQLYTWICKQKEYRYLWDTVSFRERLKDALYHSAMNSAGAKKIPLSACIYKKDKEYGFYYYDPNRLWSGNGTSKEVDSSIVG